MKKTKKKRLTLHQKAEKALKEAVKEVVDKARREKRHIAIWENGKVKRIIPK